jgi:hypothetical protein
VWIAPALRRNKKTASFAFATKRFFVARPVRAKALRSGTRTIAARRILIFEVHRALKPFWLCAHPFGEIGRNATIDKIERAWRSA